MRDTKLAKKKIVDNTFQIFFAKPESSRFLHSQFEFSSQMPLMRSHLPQKQYNLISW